MTLAFDDVLTSCVLCGSTLAPFDRFELRGTELRYDACKGCGLVHMNPRPTVEDLDRHYAEEYRLVMGDVAGEETSDAQVRRSRQQRQFIGVTPERHLDVGCSMGTLLNEIGATTKTGVEPGAEHRAIAREAGIDAHATIEDLKATDPEPFDLVTLSHVLEHTTDPVGFLDELRPLIAPGGRLLIEVPYLYRSLAYELAHLLCFARPTLDATVHAAGYEVVERRTHVARQGGLGNGRNLAVLAVPAPAVPPRRGRQVVALLRARRKVGFAPQLGYRWVRGQKRRARRIARTVWARLRR